MSEDKKEFIWLITPLVCIAICMNLGLMLVQDIFHTLTYEYLIYPARTLQASNLSYEHRFDNQTDKVSGIISGSQIGTILSLCREYKMGSKCIDSLLAIGWVESRWNIGAILHNSNSTTDRGFYQINSIHGFTEYGDFRAETEWTIKNLLKNGWAENEDRAVLRHHSKTVKLQIKYSQKIKLAKKLIN